MPSPVGHSLTGYLIYRVAAGKIAPNKRWQILALYLVAANAPDLDFIPGLLMGDPGRYHHGPSHSLGFAILFGLALSLTTGLVKLGDGIRNFTVFFSLYFSHVLLDYLSTDTSIPYGVQLFWPVSHEYYIAPFAFLPDIHRPVSSGMKFITGVLSLHNLWAATVEALLFGFLIFLFTVRNGRVINRSTTRDAASQNMFPQ
jgi:inner membrane protein